MRNTPNVKAERYRVREGYLASDASYGSNGAFLVPCGNVDLFVVASDGGGWDHVSVSVDANPKRCPTWGEMCFVKTLFFKDDETVVQFHPRKSEYVNFHEATLHLWRHQGAGHELPPSWMVGPK
jgi:hypothetical protein